jgi:hypothetical protein
VCVCVCVLSLPLYAALLVFTVYCFVHAGNIFSREGKLTPKCVTVVEPDMIYFGNMFVFLKSRFWKDSVGFWVWFCWGC